MVRVRRGGPVDEFPEARGRLVGLAREQGTGRGPDGVDVGERGRVGAVQDLRRDVAGRANGEADARKARVPRPERDPEVRQLYPPAGVHERVLRLYVAVDYALPVGVDEGFEDLGQRVDDLLYVVPFGRLVERHPPHILGYEVDLMVAGDDLERLYDVLVPEPFGDLALPEGARALAGVVDGDDLDGHVFAPEGALERTGAPHGREAAAPDHLGQRVASLSFDVARLCHS